MERNTGDERVAESVTPRIQSVQVFAGDPGAGPLPDVQNDARHADPKTTMRYDRNRHSLDRHPTHAIARYIAGSEEATGASYAGCRPK